MHAECQIIVNLLLVFLLRLKAMIHDFKSYPMYISYMDLSRISMIGLLSPMTGYHLAIPI